MPTDSPDKAPIFEILDRFHTGQYQNFFVPNFLMPISASASDNLYLSCAFSLNSQSSFLLEVDMRLFPSDRVCTRPKSRSLFPLDKAPSTLESDSLPRTSFLVLDHKSALSHGTPHLMMLAAENQRHRREEDCPASFTSGFRKLRLWW